MTPRKHPIDGVVGAAEAQQILSQGRTATVDRASIHRWGRQGHLKIVYQLPGKNGAVLFDRESVERYAQHLATNHTDNSESASA